ncbi:THUMP domain-containing protein [Nitrosopumilus sp.]|uniref:THUMP domain-containing protein n=1 Tax=Nitrosopumilus sp. TaxID=2024843 RepID=UPI003B5B4FF3
MNLIVTCARNLESETKQELLEKLDEMGDSEPKISETTMSGILTVETKIEPTLVVRKIRESILDEPWSIRYCLRIIPIQKVCNTDSKNIEETVEKLSEKIQEGETYRISIEKRDSEISSKELISNIASKIKNQVSLEFPDKIILIEILGQKTGIAIIRKIDIMSTEKTKRSISE